jgi:ectoine hydroxylase-related dioxygenase (phytanoyl-CoA dioxygenase family)
MDAVLSEIDYRPYLDTLDKLGFCVFPAFDKEEIEQLHELYNANFGNEKVKKLYATHNSNPIEKSLRINDEIKKIVDDKLQAVFPGYDYFIGHFMIKAANEKKEFPLHQDWNIVDENKYKSYQVWIPLQLTYPANGGMFVVPGSHKFFNNFRSGSYDIPRLPFDEKFKPVITNLNVPAGDVLVYHNALFHASYPNTTDDNRIVVIVNYAEKDAPTFYFHKEPEKGVTELYNIDAEILVKNLPVLEKGFINDDFPFAENVPLCPVENENITPDDLVMQYHKNMGEGHAGQTKQLHIALDETLEKELNERGYAVIDLLSADEVEVFKEGYKTIFGDLSHKNDSLLSIQYAHYDLKKNVNRFINTHIDKPLRRYFKDFTIPFSVFYTKWANTAGEVELHGDDTVILNNQLEPHYGIWVPLCDVGANNGTLSVIPGSHKVQGAIFAGSVSAYHYEHKEWLKRFEIPLHLKAGQAVVFDHNLLHNSTPNNTNADRVCFTFSITHNASQYYSFYGENSGRDIIFTFREPHDFQLDESRKAGKLKPERPEDGVIKNSLLKITAADLEKILEAF